MGQTHASDTFQGQRPAPATPGRQRQSRPNCPQPSDCPARRRFAATRWVGIVNLSPQSEPVNRLANSQSGGGANPTPQNVPVSEAKLGLRLCSYRQPQAKLGSCSIGLDRELDLTQPTDQRRGSSATRRQLLAGQSSRTPRHECQQLVATHL